METKELRIGRTLVMALTGRLDAQGAETFQERLLGRVDAGEESILLDLAQLDYVSSAGLRILLTAAKRLQATGGRLAMCSPRGEVDKIFRMTGFDSIAEVHRDRDTALNKLS